LWTAKLKTYLISQTLWKVVQNGSNLTPLSNNPTMTQIRFHNIEVVKEGRALVIIHTTIYNDTFINILNLETAKEA